MLWAKHDRTRINAGYPEGVEIFTRIAAPHIMNPRLK
jgi:hypothetical protein